MDILDADYPKKYHVFAYDITACHPNALSAVKMQLKPNPKFSCDKAKTIRMMDGRFVDGTSQALYFPEDHPTYPGYFKGMCQIINEWHEKGANLPDPKKLRSQCPNFKCKWTTSTTCCCRKVLYTKPDFVNQKSQLEEVCAAQGYAVIFFPKYHPELNFIEQVWGYAK